MRRASLCTVAFGMLGLLVVAPAAAQDMMQHVDLTSPEMTAAEMTRAEVEAAIAAAQRAMRLSPLDPDICGLPRRARVQREVAEEVRSQDGWREPVVHVAFTPLGPGSERRSE
jgi:hypothetical protein